MKFMDSVIIKKNRVILFLVFQSGFEISISFFV